MSRPRVTRFQGRMRNYNNSSEFGDVACPAVISRQRGQPPQGILFSQTRFSGCFNRQDNGMASTDYCWCEKDRLDHTISCEGTGVNGGKETRSTTKPQNHNTLAAIMRVGVPRRDKIPPSLCWLCLKLSDERPGSV